MLRTILSLAAASLFLSGCAAGVSGMAESPLRTGVHFYGAPGFALGEVDEGRTIHPVLGYSRVDGNIWTVGGQLRQGLEAADGRLWAGAEASYLRIVSVNAFSVGALAGYQLMGFPWPASAYGYLGYLDAVGRGYFVRLGLEVQPPQLMDLLPR